MEWYECGITNPENDEDVLVYYSLDDHMSVGSFDIDRVQTYIDDDGKLKYMNTGWESEINWGPKSSPTHWCYLPNPPERSREEDLNKNFRL